MVADLWESHRSAVDGWCEFDAFLNSVLPLTELIASGSGILATGPKAILETYAQVVARHGLRVAWVGESAPTQWRNGAWLPEPHDLDVLVLGNSFLVGRNWREARQVT